MPPCGTPVLTRLQTQTLDFLCPPLAYNGHRDRLQPAETTSPYSVCGHTLTAAFDTVSHDTLISKIVGSSLPPAITQWLSCYLRGRQAATSFRGTKSSTRIVRTGVPQGSKLCCCLPTPMTLASGGSPMFPLVVHQPASPSIWPAVQSLRRGLSTNTGVTMWCVCGCS